MASCGSYWGAHLLPLPSLLVLRSLPTFMPPSHPGIGGWIMLQRLSFPLLLKPLIPNTSLSLLHVGMSKNYLNKGEENVYLYTKSDSNSLWEKNQKLNFSRRIPLCLPKVPVYSLHLEVSTPLFPSRLPLFFFNSLHMETPPHSQCRKPYPLSIAVGLILESTCSMQPCHLRVTILFPKCIF